MQTSEQLFEKAKQLMPGGVNSPVRSFRSVGGTPFFTVRAKGASLFTADGRELIDFVCTWGPAILGHNHDRIRNMVAETLSRGTSFGTPGPLEVRMAELVCKLVPSAVKVRMVSSGTEATMTAIRLARGYTGRSRIIKFSGCYHGHVDSLLVKAGSGALTLGQPDSAGIPEGLAKETLVLPFNDEAALEAAFAEQGEQIAGVIVEPYPANCGLILPQAGFLKKLREITAKHDSLLIFDEVMTGFRVGPGGVQEREGVMPDLSCLGKVIGGGLPVGAVAGRAEVMDYLAPLGPVYQAGTLSGNPLAMAAGVAALEELEERQAWGGLEARTVQLTDAIAEAAQKKGLPLQVPRVPSMFCLFFAEEPVVNDEQAMASQTDLFKKLFHAALEAGVYLPPSPYETCFLSTAHDEGVIEQASEVLSGAITGL